MNTQLNHAVSNLLNSLRDIESVIAIGDGKKPSGNVLGLLASMGNLPEEIHAEALRILTVEGSPDDVLWASQMITSSQVLGLMS